MVANFGYGALVIAFLVSLYGAFAAVYGVRQKAPAWIDSARNAMLLTWPLITLSALSIIFLLVNNHYEVEYVSSVTSLSMPLYLKITALWGGQNGSILFWSLLLSGYNFALMWTARGDRMLLPGGQAAPLLPWAIVGTMITQGFFLALVLFLANPFALWWA